MSEEEVKSDDIIAKIKKQAEERIEKEQEFMEEIKKERTGYIPWREMTQMEKAAEMYRRQGSPIVIWQSGRRLKLKYKKSCRNCLRCTNGASVVSFQIPGQGSYDAVETGEIGAGIYTPKNRRHDREHGKMKKRHRVKLKRIIKAAVMIGGQDDI